MSGLNKSKDSSKGKNTSKNSSDLFNKGIKPVTLDDTNPIIKKKSSGRDSNINEQISDNYEDEDFEIGESLPRDVSGNQGQDDFFNQNKNFSGNLAGLGKNLDGAKDDKEKDSEPSGLGFEDNYDYF
jgi:hypothetical protein